jgi:hypothetical protein
VGNVLSDDDADAAFDELDIDASLDMEGKEEDTIAVVDLNTPLYVVDTEEDDVEEHTSDEQQGIGVAVVVAVEKAPP